MIIFGQTINLNTNSVVTKHLNPAVTLHLNQILTKIQMYMLCLISYIYASYKSNPACFNNGIERSTLTKYVSYEAGNETITVLLSWNSSDADL